MVRAPLTTGVTTSFGSGEREVSVATWMMPRTPWVMVILGFVGAHGMRIDARDINVLSSTFKRVLDGFRVLEVLHFNQLELPRTMVLLEELWHPCVFCHVSDGASDFVACSYDLVTDMARDVTVCACDQDGGS